MTREVLLQFSWSLVCCCACLVSVRGADLPPFPDAQPYTAEQNKWLAERAILRDRALTLLKTDLQQATTNAEKMLIVDRQLFGNVHKEVASSLNFVELLYYRQADWFAASKAREEIMQITSKLLGEKSWRVKEQQFERDLYGAISKFSAAEHQEFYQAGVAYIEANSLLVQGKPQEAVPHTTKSLQLLERLIGKDNPRHAYALYLHGDCLFGLGRNAEAEAALTAAAKIQLAYFGADSLDYANTNFSLGKLYVRLNSTEQAERALRAAIKVFEQERADGAVGNAYVSLSHVYSARNEPSRALETLKVAIDFIGKVHGKESLYYALVREQLCKLLIEVGDINEAEKVAREVLTEFNRHKDWGSNEIVYYRSPERMLINILLRRNNKTAEAMKVIQELKGLPVFKNRNAKATIAEVVAVSDLTNLEATAYIQLRDYEAADPVARDLLSLAIQHKATGSCPKCETGVP